jgi:hypothetical protein
LALANQETGKPQCLDFSSLLTIQSCSAEGNCGRGFNFCASPPCQEAFSNGCDGSQRPHGQSTLSIPRYRKGSASYDPSGIDRCSVLGTVALIFDDGPFNFTAHILDVLKSYSAKATFFITGNNLGKGQIDAEETGWPDILRRMHVEGHQIASHVSCVIGGNNSEAGQY